MTRQSKLMAKYEAWIAQAEWIVKFLEKLQAAPSAHGLSWTHSMVMHYKEKFMLHRQHMPRGCKKRAGEYEQRINKVLAWLKKQP